jgi:hypothetical protein
MYKIYKENQVIATTEKPVYIKKHPTNDCYVPASESDATGIAVQSLSQIYTLAGKELDDLEQVIIVESDSGMDIENITDTLDIDINSKKSEKEKAIVYTKKLLKHRLDEGMTWTNGKKYSITLEKQNLLSAQLGMYMINAQAGIEIPLTWNASGEPCEPWTVENLCALANDISAIVSPLVSKQQYAEVKLNEAETNEEIEEILNEFVLQLD